MSSPERRPGELNVRELARWLWRQLTSMRIALILLLLLALAAVPGSIIPQRGVDALKTANWQDQHPKLTPVYEKLGLFAVYDSPWFSAIYLLLVISLVGCIVPRTWVYARAIRADPPPAPRNLGRLPDHASYDTDERVDEVLDRARVVLRAKGYRVRASDRDDDAVSAERGYLREVGNLVFHLSVLVVLVGFAMGGLFGYKGGVILVVGNGFANNLTQYDDFVPGRLFNAQDLDPFSFVVDQFDVDWLTSGPRQGMARGFDAHLRYRESPTADEKSYDLRVNHPLTIGGTEVFLIGHGYAPVITVRDGEGNIAYRGPTVFLPQDQTFLSFGVVKAPDAKPAQIGLEGLFYPTFINMGGDPVNVMGDDKNPKLSMLVYTGDLGMDNGTPQSVYVLDKAGTEPVKNDKGKPLRIDLSVGDKVKLPDGLGTVSFDDVVQWNRIQISQTPGKRIALGGVVLALIGLLGSLFIRPRRTWVRARREGGVTLVEVAALDRSGGGDVSGVIDDVVSALRGAQHKPGSEEKS
ncbi:cytochrome c biogenesis protein ResB [Nocardioides sp.]|uniref:cytochrome c biogenesis protein ResB n=1 Tax=Nocardioides sp. TaxID=35761 RepID=UPI0031FF01F6|nr:ccs1 [Nocardioides sp.]